MVSWNTLVIDSHTSSLKPFEEEEWAMEQLLLTIKLMLLEERLTSIRKFPAI